MELLDPQGDLFGGRIIASSATTEDGAPVDQAKSLMLARFVTYSPSGKSLWTRPRASRWHVWKPIHPLGSPCGPGQEPHAGTSRNSFTLWEAWLVQYYIKPTFLTCTQLSQVVIVHCS